MSDAEHFLHERYQDRQAESVLRRAYYAAKPFLPRRVQLAMRRRYAPVQARREFPAWPQEPVLLRLRDGEIRARLAESGQERLPMVGYWPRGHRFSAILTHDVEGPAGVDNVRRVIEVEQRHGFVSSWNFVAEWYPIPEGLFDHVRASGCEIGLHGIKHDGKLFAERRNFEADLPKIADYAARWEVEGFRSPATHRNADWMHELPVRYDSSFPDTDPFEPQSGGCCSIFPFFFGDVVELPITLVQDHTLWQILRDPGVDAWIDKTRWLAANHGLVNIIIHPDYVVDPERLALYERFLVFLREQEGMWHALPRDVAAWWRRRDALEIVARADGTHEIRGPGAEEATLMYAREQDGRIVFDF